MEKAFEQALSALQKIDTVHAESLISAIERIKNSVKVIDGLEEVSNQTYTIQPIKVWTDGSLGIYADKDEKIVFGKSVEAIPLKQVVYRTIYDIDTKKIVQRVYDSKIEIPKRDNIAIYSVKAMFFITSDLKNFFVFEGVRSKIDASNELEDIIKTNIKGKTALYELKINLKSVKKKVKTGEFYSLKPEFAGDTEPEKLPVLKIAKQFVSDYVDYRRERKVVLKDSEVETEETQIEEMY